MCDLGVVLTTGLGENRLRFGKKKNLFLRGVGQDLRDIAIIYKWSHGRYILFLANQFFKKYS